MSENDTKLVLATDFRQLVNQIYQNPTKIRGDPLNLASHTEIILAETSKNLKFNENYPEPAQKRVCAVLPESLSKIPDSLNSWAELIKKFEPYFAWKQNESYRGIYPDMFYDKYACVELIGPNAMLISDEIRAGFLLLDGGLCYPQHNHEALEIYHVLNVGDSSWQKGEESDFVEMNAGEGVFHETFESHAMRTGEKPMIALYTWTGFGAKDDGFARPLCDSRENLIK